MIKSQSKIFLKFLSSNITKPTQKCYTLSRKQINFYFLLIIYNKNVFLVQTLLLAFYTYIDSY